MALVYCFSLSRHTETARNFAGDQKSLFAWIADLLSNTMAMDGEACVKRLICELSHQPIDELSFMGEVVHNIFE